MDTIIGSLNDIFGQLEGFFYDIVDKISDLFSGSLGSSAPETPETPEPTG